MYDKDDCWHVEGRLTHFDIEVSCSEWIVKKSTHIKEHLCNVSERTMSVASYMSFKNRIDLLFFTLTAKIML